MSKFDITDGANRYAPCVRCGATTGMGLSTVDGQLAVRCLCGARGPTAEDDEAAFDGWNAASNAHPEAHK